MQRFRELSSPSNIPGRPSWSHRLDFTVALFSQLNVPSVFYLAFLPCYANGTSISLLLGFIFFSFPGTVLETALGQLSARSTIEVWDLIAPVFKGLGVVCTIITFSNCCSAAQHCGIVLFYMVFTFDGNSSLPWSSCSENWNTPKCVTNGTMADRHSSPSAQEFLSYRILQSSSLKHDQQAIVPSGIFNFRLAGCSLIVWSFCVLVLMCGIRLLPKVLSVLLSLATVLSILVVGRLAFLPGSSEGMSYALNFRLQKSLYSIYKQIDMITSVGYTLGMFSGSLFTVASYNNFKFKHTIDCFAAHVYLLVQIFIFSAMFYLSAGSLAYLNKRAFNCFSFDRIEDAFLVNTAPLLASASGARVWSLALFLGLFFFDLAYLLTHCEVLVTSLLDLCGSHQRASRWTVAGFVSCLGILMTSLASTSTSYALNNWYEHIGLFYIVICLLFVFSCTCLFGSNRLVTFIALMNNCFCLSKYLRFSWLVILPLIIVLSCYSVMVTLLNILPFAIWLLVILFQFLLSQGAVKERILTLFKPRRHKQFSARFVWKELWAPLASLPSDVDTEEEAEAEEEEEDVEIKEEETDTAV